jgi:succinyl-CoA synthetase beta subunit
VVRLDGTNAEEGRRLLAESASDKVVPAATMLAAASKAVELAGTSAAASQGTSGAAPQGAN